MSKFLTKSLSLAFLFFVLCLILDVVVSKGLRKSELGSFKEWNEILSGNINADLVVLGSSNASVHLSPSVLDSVLKTKTYNLGINGYNFLMQEQKFDLFTANNSAPDFVIHVVGPTTLSRRDTLKFKKQFLPYISNPILRKVLQKYEGLRLLDYYLPLIRYRGRAKLMKSGFLEFANIRHYSDAKRNGFRSFDLEWSPEPSEVFRSGYPNRMVVDDEVIKQYHQFIQDQQAKGVKLFMVNSPFYCVDQKYISNLDSINNIYSEISSTYGLPYWDYTQDSLSCDTSNFMEYNHLNTTGAMKFSKEIGERIKNYVAD